MTLAIIYGIVAGTLASAVVASVLWALSRWLDAQEERDDIAHSKKWHEVRKAHCLYCGKRCDVLMYGWCGECEEQPTMEGWKR